MPKKVKELSALEVGRLSAPGYHFVGGVDGLILQISPTGSKSWILRTTIGKSRPELGLGGFPDVTLAQAKERAREMKDQIRKGIDPREEQRNAQSALIAARATDITFEDFARQYIESNEAAWGVRSHKQWLSSLEKHAFPKIGKLYVRHVDTPQVLEVLEPIWTKITETATRVRGRIEKILASAIVKKLRDGPNPAAWTNHLQLMLPAPEKLINEEHHPALPYARMYAFMKDLRQHEGQGARCLEFLIFTATRSNEARGAAWSEVDLPKKIWTIPAERMGKSNKEHRIPLSDPAIRLLKAQHRLEGTDLIFPSPMKGVQLSDATLGAVMKRMGITSAEGVPHGFRSTFKDWATELTSYPNDMSEIALAHQVGSKVEQAYRRGDMFAKRRQQMNDWAKFCESEYVESAYEGAEVIPLPARHG